MRIKQADKWAFGVMARERKNGWRVGTQTADVSHLHQCLFSFFHRLIALLLFELDVCIPFRYMWASR